MIATDLLSLRLPSFFTVMASTRTTGSLTEMRPLIGGLSLFWFVSIFAGVSLSRAPLTGEKGKVRNLSPIQCDIRRNRTPNNGGSTQTRKAFRFFFFLLSATWCCFVSSFFFKKKFLYCRSFRLDSNSFSLSLFFLLSFSSPKNKETRLKNDNNDDGCAVRFMTEVDFLRPISSDVGE